MSIQDRDYLKRQIEKLAELVAALLGQSGSVDATETRRACDRLKATLLGPLRDGLDRLEPSSALVLLGGADKARLVAQVLELEGDLLERAGDAGGAAAARRDAKALLDAANRRRTP